MRIRDWAKGRTDRTLAALRKEAQEVDSGVAGDTIFSAKAVMFIAERLVEIEKALVKQNGHAKRKPTEWQRFVGRGMKAGKSLKQVAEEWRARNG